MKVLFLSLVALLIAQPLYSQDELWLEPISLGTNDGLQSFAHGHFQDKFYLFGGRLDGLHQRQPFASFDNNGHNDELWIIEADSSIYRLALQHLPDSLYDQLRSTNMQFYQVDSLLYLVGGYGISSSNGNHLTHPLLSIVNLGQLQNLNPGDSVPNSAFQQISHPDFAVTGGQLRRMDSTFYLVGGHRFDGRYNPHNGPSFTQAYTNSVRRFQVNGIFPNLQIQWQASIDDPQLLHRRDFNVAPEIKENGDYGLVAFSGVFQVNVDLPYLNAVRIGDNSISEISNFSQYYNHYHCANIPLYQANAKQMHTLFFGGIAQYYEENGLRTQDNNVPFVNTIARVSRDSLGNYSESKLKVEMPALLGAGSEFFIADGLPLSAAGIIDYDALQGDTVLIGYIFGGIESSAPNIFFSNTGSQSLASPKLFKVHIIRSKLNLSANTPALSANQFAWQLYPNPGGKMQIWYAKLKAPCEMQLKLIDQSGKTIWTEKWKHSEGDDHKLLNPTNLKEGSYIVELYLDAKLASRQRWVYRSF